MANDAFDLSGQVAVVTDDGIGKAVARLLARHGADIVLAGSTLATLDETVTQIRALGRRALAVVADVSKSEDCERLIEQAICEFGQIDILINTAGGSQQRPLEQWDQASWRDMINRNLRSAFMLSQGAGRHMVPRKRGAIVNIALGAGGIGLPNGVIRAGIDNLTKALAAAWGPHGVRVNCVAIDDRAVRDPAAESDQIADVILFCTACNMGGETLTVVVGQAEQELP